MTSGETLSGPRVLYQSAAVILGETRVDLGGGGFHRESVAEVWPSIAFPRAPLGIRHADADPVIGDANTAILFSVGRPYRRISINGQGSWTEWIEIRPDLLEEMAGTASPFRLGGTPAPARAYLAHRRARRRLARDGVADPLALEESALAIAGEVLAAGAGTPGLGRGSRRPDRVRAPRDVVFGVQAMLNLHLESSLSLREISDAVGVSPFHLCRLFRRRIGLPIHRYRDRLRLRAALDRIAENKTPMLEIALDLGYSSEAHFSNAFLRAFGTRPSAFRRSLGRGRPDANRRAGGQAR